ncbi:hypothetical protein D7Z26_11615 [Cohnella endophytica]|uniref:SLH domain-containing protein n=1 Tax=Cohnella endophytica TaxID=2419778 RepID=A0A494XTW7_9BACL|nr:S-layer homology domain-containing protein [Cohnella endophytica]RKP54030.1 hypothetical protein D7Z26_11615 [Cohnella endophytica]
MNRLRAYMRTRIATKLVSTFLSIALLFTILPLTASAETAVAAAEISIGTVAPLNGASIANGTIEFGGGTVTDVKWSTDGTNYAAASGTFAQSKIYHTRYVFTADLNHVFDAAAGAYQKGGAQDLSSRIANLGSGTFTATVSQAFTLNDTLTVVVTWPNATIEPSDISIGTIAPVKGAAIADGANTFNHASTVITWSATGGSFSPASGTFAPSTNYYTKYVITADAGYAFDNTSRIYQDGSKSLASRIVNLGTGFLAGALVNTTVRANDTLTLVVMWGSTANATGQAIIDAADILIGTAAPAPFAVVADGTNIFTRGAIDYVEWYTSNYSKALSVGDPFVSGTTYRTGYELLAANGYAFDTPSAYRKGGARDLSSRIANLGTGTFNVTSPDGVDLYIDVIWPQTGIIVPSDISVGTLAPVAEASMTNGANTFSHASPTIKWSADNGTSYNAASGTYAYETTYKTQYVLAAAAGYSFDPAAGVYGASGAKALTSRIANLGSGSYTAVVSGASNDKLTMEITWPKTAAVPQTTVAAAGLSIGTAAPVSGQSIMNGTNTLPHTSASVTWSNDNGATYAAAGGTFAPGKAYRSKYVLTADTGYIFDSTAGAYNGIAIANLGTGTFAAQVSTTSTANDTLTITVTWPATATATIAVADLGIGTLAPVAGQNMADGANAFAHATANVTWSSDGGANYVAAGGLLAPNTVYKTKYVLTSASGYRFDQAADAYNSVAIANLGAGSFSADVSSADAANDTLTIVVTWPATGAATISSSDLTIGTVAPVTGAVQANGTNAFTHATAVVTWSGDGGTTYATASGIFAAITSYKSKYVLSASAGYAFDSTAGVYGKNGARDLAGRIANLGTGTFAATVSTASSSNDTLTVIVTWPVTAPVNIVPSDISIGTAAPLTGSAQTNGSNVFNHATASIGWSSDNGSSYNPAGGIFAIGTSYKTKYVLTAVSGYQFNATAGAYNAISIANLGTGTFTVQVSTTSLPNDTLTIIVAWPATAITDTVKISLNNTVDFQAYSGNTLIPSLGLSVAAEDDYSITLVNNSIDTADPSAPLTAAMVKSIRVLDNQGNNMLKSIQAVSSGVAQNHPWSLKLTINKNSLSAVRTITVTVDTATALRIDIRNLVGFTSPTIEYAIQPNSRNAYPYEYGNYFYFLPGDELLMKTSSLGLIPAGVQLVGKQTSKTTPVKNTLFNTTSYQFRYTFTMPNEPAFLTVTSTDGRAAHNIVVRATIPGVVLPTLSGGVTLVQATARASATDHSGDIITVNPGSYDHRIYKVTGIEVRSELLNVVLPMTDNGNGTYSFAMPFTDAIVTVLVERIVSNPIEAEVKNNSGAQATQDLEAYYAGDTINLQIVNTDPTKFVSSIQIWRVFENTSTLIKQGRATDPYASRIDFSIKPYTSTAPLVAGATLKAVVNFDNISIPVFTSSSAQFSNYSVKVNVNEAITFTFAPPNDPSKIYKPQVMYRDSVNPSIKTVYPCIFVRTDAQDQTKSVYTCPAVTKSSTQSVELIFDSMNVELIPGAVKIKTMASIAPNSKLAGVFNSIVVYGTNMDGRGEVFLGTSPNPTTPATVSGTTSASLVVSVPASMRSNSTDVTYYVSINGVQRSVTIATAQNLSHTKFGNMAIVSDKQFNHSVIVAESEKELTQQLGDRKPIVMMKGSFTASATVTGEYQFSGTTIINGGLTSYLPTGQSKLRVRDDADGSVKITMDKVNLVAGTFSLLSASDGSIELEKGIEYVSEYAKDSDGDLLDPDKQNVEVAFENRNQLTVLGSGMTAKITGATLTGNAIMFDGKVYFGMALPGSGNVGIGLNIDRLQYGVDGQGSLNFQGVKADGSFTTGNDMSKKLLGGFGLSATAEGSIDTFENKYSVAFDMDAKLANFAAEMSLKKNGANGQFIPDTIKIVVGLSDGIPVTPALPIAKLTRVGGGVSGLADTITGNYKGVAPILILINGDLEVGSLLPGKGLLEFSDVQLAIGPSQISLSGKPKLLKMEIFDKFQAGIYLTNTSVSYQMEVAANILKNFSVILAGGNANLTYSRGGSFNLNGQLRGRLQVPEFDIGLFSIGPYTLLNSDVGLSNTNAYATFSVIGLGFKVNYAFGSGSVSVGRRSLSSMQTEQAGQTVFDENGSAVGQINSFSNVKLVASSDAPSRQFRSFALTPTISTNGSGKVHTVTFPAGLTDDYAVLVSADPDDISILDPDGNPYGLTYPVTLNDGTPFYNDPNANAAVVSDNTIMIRLGAQTGDWTISSSQPFDSSVIAVTPVPKIVGTTYNAVARSASWDLTGLDTATEDYRVEVRLSTDNGDDPTDTSAGVLIHTVDIDALQVTDRAVSGSYVFTAEDLSYLQSGQYYPRVTLIGTPKSDASRTIPYASMNAKQVMNVVNPLAPDSVSAVLVSAGGGGTIHATWSAVSNADGYLVRLYDADGNAVMSPLKYTDEVDSDGNPTGNRIAHAGRPIEYQISADDAVGGTFNLDFGGMEPGNSYKLAVTPYASVDPAASNASFIYGASTVSTVVDVPLVKTPVIHVASNSGAIASDLLMGNVLTVNGGFKLDVATTYVSAEDGQSQNLNAKFTVWQSDGTINEVTNIPNVYRIYTSGDYENQISVPISLDGDIGSSLIRIVAENDQGDVSEYGLAVRYNRLPPALFVETGPDGKIVTDSEGRYQIQGSTVPNATVLDSRGSRTTADDAGKFSMSGTLDADTEAYLTLTAIDYVGNFAQDDVTVIKGDAPANPGTGTGAGPGGTPGGQTGGGQAGTGQTDGSTDNGNPPKSTFKDVHAEVPWAEAAIEKAYKMGIVAGRTPEVFAPNSHTRREEAIAMLVRARKFTIGNQSDLDAAAAYFADWNELAEWSRPYIAAAYANGLVTGSAHNGKHYVKGSSFVTRAEVAVLFQNAYRMNADAGNRKSFEDQIPSWAADSVEVLSSNGVIKGYPNATFMPGSNATRAEIVVMLMRLIERE